MSVELKRPLVSRQSTTIRAAGESLVEARERARAELVRAFWAEKGHTVKIRIERVEIAGLTLPCLRSNLIGGLPRNSQPEVFQSKQLEDGLDRLS
jgi:hypothetical protein